MIGALTVNGQEAEATFGIVVVGFGGDMGTGGRTISLLDIPARPGLVDAGITPDEAARTLTVDFLVSAATDAALRTALDAIVEECGTGLVELRSLYSTTRALYGVLQPFDVVRRDTAIAGWARGTMQFVCPCPYWLALSPDTISFGATPVAIPLGTAPSAGRDQWSAIIEIVGAATTPTLTYRDMTGTAVGTMVFSGYSPAAGDHITVDLGRSLVTKVVSGTRTNAFSALTAGYTFPTLDPGDGYVAGSVFPTLAVDSGSAFLRYHRAWR